MSCVSAVYEALGVAITHERTVAIDIINRLQEAQRMGAACLHVAISMLDEMFRRQP